MIELQNLNIIKELQIACNASMNRVFDYVKSHTIDESKLQIVQDTYVPSIGSVGWYLIKQGTVSKFIGFADRRDTSYDYQVIIYTHGGYSSYPNCCTSNPIKECACSDNDCIFTTWSSRGSGATGTATVSGGAVTGVTITNQGSGYNIAPNITFSTGGGTGATATANLTGDKVTSVTITNGGSGYTFAPTVSILQRVGLDVPNSQIDYALNTLPIVVNWGLIAVGAVIVIGALIFITRSKKEKK